MTTWRIVHADIEQTPNGVKVSYLNMFGRVIDVGDYSNLAEAEETIRWAERNQKSPIQVTKP